MAHDDDALVRPQAASVQGADMSVHTGTHGGRRISLVLPAFNEAEGIGQTLATLERVLSGLSFRWEVVIVNDGSRDDTLAQARTFASKTMEIVTVDLSRNFGKEAALSAGIEIASGEAVIPIDADLQDPPELIPEMLALWEQGAEVVLARRADRRSDGWLKRTSAAWFYRLINRVSDVPIPENVGDFRLMDRRVVEVLRHLPENRRFMKGLFAWAGFRTAQVDYVRPVRVAGESKFGAFRLLNLAVEGITSFSTAPLRLATYIGGGIALLAFGYAVFIILRTLVSGVDLPGYASLFSAMLFLSGMQLLALGVIGEYVGRTYLESKRRPAFVVRRIWRRAPGEAAPSEVEPRALSARD
jgi:polyisoprenyl-phosphate glycosyltransferase